MQFLTTKPRKLNRMNCVISVQKFLLLGHVKHKKSSIWQFKSVCALWDNDLSIYLYTKWRYSHQTQWTTVKHLISLLTRSCMCVNIYVIPVDAVELVSQQMFVIHIDIRFSQMEWRMVSRTGAEFESFIPLYKKRWAAFFERHRFSRQTMIYALHNGMKCFLRISCIRTACCSRPLFIYWIQQYHIDVLLMLSWNGHT